MGSKGGERGTRTVHFDASSFGGASFPDLDVLSRCVVDEDDRSGQVDSKERLLQSLKAQMECATDFNCTDRGWTF